jgi:hypothetical protein
MGYYLSKEFVPQIDVASQELINMITQIRKKGNFQTVRKVLGDKKIKELLQSLYPKFDIVSLEKIFGVADSTLSHWFKVLGIKTTRRHISNQAVAANFNGNIIITKNNKSIKLSAIKITPELSYLIGFALGDGSIQKYQVEVFNQDKGMYTYLHKIMNKLGPVSLDQRDDGLWRIRLSNTKIADIIKRNKQVRIDTLEFILSDSILASRFIAGFWDAEGSVLKQAKYFHVYLYNSNKDLLDYIADYLKQNGIKFSILKLKERRKEYFIRGRLVKSKKQMYRLGIPKSHVKQWANEIGLYLLHSKKKIIVSEIIKERD